MANSSKIRMVPLDDLTGDDRNPKKHDLPGIMAAMRDLGFADPPTVDQRTGLLVGGHGRVEALRAMRENGEQPPEGIDPDGWKVPTFVGWASTDDDHAGRALVALNRLTERGGWDARRLSDLLERVGTSGTGYGSEDVDRLRTKLGLVAADTDAVVEDQQLRQFDRTFFLIAAPIDRHGDVWDVLAALDGMEGVDVAASQG